MTPGFWGLARARPYETFSDKLVVTVGAALTPFDTGGVRAWSKEYKVGQSIRTPEPRPPRTGESVSLGRASRKVTMCPLCSH